MGLQVDDSQNAISDINITPFVDVILVLLLVFMISAPLMFNNIDLSLPKTKKVNKLKITKENIVLSMTKNGEFFLGKTKMSWEKVLQELIQSSKNKNLDQKVFIRADFSIPYGQLAQVLSELKRNGINSISLVTQSE